MDEGWIQVGKGKESTCEKLKVGLDLPSSSNRLVEGIREIEEISDKDQGAPISLVDCQVVRSTNASGNQEHGDSSDSDGLQTLCQGQKPMSPVQKVGFGLVKSGFKSSSFEVSGEVWPPFSQQVLEVHGSPCLLGRVMCDALADCADALAGCILALL
ncbi:hypothetical protein U1Q18_019523 [Sarracenia purpurea var. burkii]